MSNDAIQETASELKPVTSSTTANSSSFSVTDILSPLEVVDHHSASYMGPASPSEASAASNSAASNHFSAYSAAYSPRSVTPITSMAASAAAAVAATSVSYPHMHSMTQLNSPAAASFSSGYCQPTSTDLGHHYPDMRTSAASAATGWYSSPAADPRFASEYCKYNAMLVMGRSGTRNSGYRVVEFPSSNLGWL